MPYSPEHKFSKTASEAFSTIGEWCFVNPISSQPWRGRSRVVAKMQVFEKYLTDDDAITAAWVQKQGKKNDPSWRSDDDGIVRINKILDERSNGTWRDEVSTLISSLPTEMDYATEALDYLTVEQRREVTAKQRREKFKVVK